MIKINNNKNKSKKNYINKLKKQIISTKNRGKSLKKCETCW
jgi:hypothetical protein